MLYIYNNIYIYYSDIYITIGHFGIGTEPFSLLSSPSLYVYQTAFLLTRLLSPVSERTDFTQVTTVSIYMACRMISTYISSAVSIDLCLLIQYTKHRQVQLGPLLKLGRTK